MIRPPNRDFPIRPGGLSVETFLEALGLWDLLAGELPFAYIGHVQHGGGDTDVVIMNYDSEPIVDIKFNTDGDLQRNYRRVGIEHLGDDEARDLWTQGAERFPVGWTTGGHVLRKLLIGVPPGYGTEADLARALGVTRSTVSRMWSNDLSMKMLLAVQAHWIGFHDLLQFVLRRDHGIIPGYVTNEAGARVDDMTRNRLGLALKDTENWPEGEPRLVSPCWDATDAANPAKSQPED